MIPAASIASVAPSRRRRSKHWLLASLAVAATLIVVACSNVTPSTSPSGIEAATDTPGPVGTGPTPRPTAWPGSVVAATVALGAADGDFEKMGNDLQSAVDAGDLQALLGVTGDSLTFLQANQKNIPSLQGYPETKALGDALAVAYQEMIAGLQKIQESLRSGDANGVQQGFQQFAAGSTDYGKVRADLGDKAEQALFMTKMLTR